MRPLVRLSLMLALLVVPSAVLGTTYLVKPDGSGSYPTIQTAVGHAVSGDTILLGDGTFLGEGNRDISYAGKAIVIKSKSNDPTLCIVDCLGVDFGFCFITGEGSGSILEGIEIRNGFGAEGGGVVVIGSSPKVINCRLVHNFATHGGGLYARNAPALQVLGCVFVSNTATGVGGGLMLKASSSPQILNCVFEGNTCDEGGGIACWEEPSTPLIEGCVLFDNLATVYGGGILCKASEPLIRTCTIVGNSSPLGGGVCVRDVGHPTLENTIVAFAEDGTGVYCVGGGASMVCSDVYGNWGDDWIGCIGGQAGAFGNLCADPQFCDAGSHDFSLQEASPCADAPTCGLVGALGVGCIAELLVVEADEPACPLSSAHLHQAYAQGSVFSARGGVPPYSWSQTGLPSGMEIDAATGEIGGTPVAAGVFPFTVTVTDQGSSTAQRECSITVESDLAVDGTTPACPIPDAVPGLAYPTGTVFSASGGTPPYSWSQTGLPDGLAIDPVSGQIFGTTLLVGTFGFTVVVEDADGSTAQRGCSVSVPDQQFVLSVRDSVAVVGESLSLRVIGWNGAPIRAFSFALRFDPRVFTLDPALIDTSGTAAVGARIIVSGSTDSTLQVGVIYSYGCPPEIGIGNHLFMKLLFHVKNGAPAGPTVMQLVDLPPALNRMTQCDGVDIAPILMSGIVAVFSEALVRDDVSGDGMLNIADPLINLAYQFEGAPIACLDAADTDDNGVITISDPSYSLSHLFGEGPPPPAPFPSCGPDVTEDDIGCECHAYCMGCRPVFPLPRFATATVLLDVGSWIPEGEDLYACPVLMSTNEPLWGFECRASYPMEALRFEGLIAPGFDYASAKSDSGEGILRIGQIHRFDLSAPIEPGVHEVGRIRFHAPTPPEPGSLRLTEGVFVQKGGASGATGIGTITGVESGEENVPGAKGLWSQASPNPFNPSVTIRYEIPGTCAVEVEVFDALGRHVKALVDGSQPPGLHQAEWDGTSEQREPVSSGIYFCAVRACGRAVIHKLTLLR